MLKERIKMNEWMNVLTVVYDFASKISSKRKPTSCYSLSVLSTAKPALGVSHRDDTSLLRDYSNWTSQTRSGSLRFYSARQTGRRRKCLATSVMCAVYNNRRVHGWSTRRAYPLCHHTLQLVMPVRASRLQAMPQCSYRQSILLDVISFNFNSGS